MDNNQNIIIISMEVKRWQLWIYFSLSLQFSPSVSIYSKWLHNTDLNNPYNWDRGSLPCGNDRMILPDDSPVVIMQLNTTIQELVLPKNTELMFGSYSTLAFTNQQDDSADCLDSGNDITFNATHPVEWLDPNNWCPTDKDNGPCKTMALLDTERIPCSTNDVIFPAGSSYYVDLGSNLSLQVRTLRLAGQSFSTSTFRDFLSTESGKNIFPETSSRMRSSITINKRKCDDQTGCACGNDQDINILTAVCQIQNLRCSQPVCAYPIRPVGHCCGVCGGIINITYGTGFNFNDMKSNLQRIILDGKDVYKKVQYIVSKQFNGRVQIVLSDNEDGKQSSKAAEEMTEQLNNDISNGGFKYRIIKASLQTSLAVSPSPSISDAHTGQDSSVSWKSITGITIGVIVAIVLLICIAYMVFRCKTSGEDFLGFGTSVFNRFRQFNRFNRFSVSESRDPQVVIPTSVGFSWCSLDSGVSSATGTICQGFDNPIFDSLPLENIKAMNLEMTPSEFGPMSDRQPTDNIGFDNPLYESVHQESIFNDGSTVTEPKQVTVMTIGGHDKETSPDTDA